MSAVIVVIIRYPQIGNKPILNVLKNNFDQFLVFWVCRENIMQHQKYVEPRKKEDDGYDLKIFMVINTHKKYYYVFFFFFIHD
jgi:hypothetical protein